MKKCNSIINLVFVLCIALFLCGCAGESSGSTVSDNNDDVPQYSYGSQESSTTAQTTQTQDPETVMTEADGSVLSAEMPDGFQFETTIMLEGMEEPVRYEHAISINTGISIDYDYERFLRRSGDASETFVSKYDEEGNYVNYLAISASPADGETMKEIIGVYLEKYFANVTVDQENIGNFTGCTRFIAEKPVTDDFPSDAVTVQYVIPANDGSRLVELHYTIESAEGFGSRMIQMLDTLNLRNINWSSR